MNEVEWVNRCELNARWTRPRTSVSASALVQARQATCNACPKRKAYFCNWGMLGCWLNYTTTGIYFPYWRKPVSLLPRKLHAPARPILTSCAGMTCHALREFFLPNCNIFSVLSIFQCNQGETNNKFITSQ